MTNCCSEVTAPKQDFLGEICGVASRRCLLGAASRRCFSALLLGAASRRCFSALPLGGPCYTGWLWSVAMAPKLLLAVAWRASFKQVCFLLSSAAFVFGKHTPSLPPQHISDKSTLFHLASETCCSLWFYSVRFRKPLQNQMLTHGGALRKALLSFSLRCCNV